MTELIRKSDALHAVLHNTGDAAVAAVQEIKAVDAVVHGEWTIGDAKLYHCSICGKTAPYDVSADVIEYWNDLNYCPNCGARIDGKENDDGRV